MAKMLTELKITTEQKCNKAVIWSLHQFYFKDICFIYRFFKTKTIFLCSILDFNEWQTHISVTIFFFTVIGVTKGTYVTKQNKVEDCRQWPMHHQGATGKSKKQSKGYQYNFSAKLWLNWQKESLDSLVMHYKCTGDILSICRWLKVGYDGLLGLWSEVNDHRAIIKGTCGLIYFTCYKKPSKLILN